MNNENDEILMSQLADGELPSDQANDLLLGVLDDADGREKLKELIRLRQATAGWRASQPARPVMIVSDQPRSMRPRRRLAWRMGGLAVAACIGGLLVLAGVWVAGWGRGPVRPLHQWQIAPGPDAPPTVARVSSEQMRQVAQAFELHESVAGPLAWYAADDQNVRLASATGTEAGRAPIGVLLRLNATSNGSGGRSLVIVCRNDEPAVIEIPAESADRPGLRVYLAPKVDDGSVQMHYAIAADGDSRQPVLASLTGQRRLGLTETPLGQLAMGDSVLHVEAAAWSLPKERN
jgi:hypothetical protein